MNESAREQVVSLTVNGSTRAVRGHPLRRLLDVLREDFGLTGTKEGCGEGECGSCIVLMDDRPVLSCLVPICQAETRRVLTIESLAGSPFVQPVQESFLEAGGTQCGICTPGVVLSALYYVEHPEAAETLEEAMAGNQCRCTGYRSILESVNKLSDRLKPREKK